MCPYVLLADPRLETAVNDPCLDRQVWYRQRDAQIASLGFSSSLSVVCGFLNFIKSSILGVRKGCGVKFSKETIAVVLLFNVHHVKK